MTPMEAALAYATTDSQADPANMAGVLDLSITSNYVSSRKDELAISKPCCPSLAPTLYGQTESGYDNLISTLETFISQQRRRPEGSGVRRSLRAVSGSADTPQHRWAGSMEDQLEVSLMGVDDLQKTCFHCMGVGNEVPPSELNSSCRAVELHSRGIDLQGGFEEYMQHSRQALLQTMRTPAQGAVDNVVNGEQSMEVGAETQWGYAIPTNTPSSCPQCALSQQTELVEEVAASRTNAVPMELDSLLTLQSPSIHNISSNTNHAPSIAKRIAQCDAVLGRPLKRQCSSSEPARPPTSVNGVLDGMRLPHYSAEESPSSYYSEARESTKMVNDVDRTQHGPDANRPQAVLLIQPDNDSAHITSMPHPVHVDGSHELYAVELCDVSHRSTRNSTCCAYCSKTSVPPPLPESAAVVESTNYQQPSRSPVLLQRDVESARCACGTSAGAAQPVPHPVRAARFAPLPTCPDSAKTSPRVDDGFLTPLSSQSSPLTGTPGDSQSPRVLFHTPPSPAPSVSPRLYIPIPTSFELITCVPPAQLEVIQSSNQCDLTSAEATEQNTEGMLEDKDESDKDALDIDDTEYALRPVRPVDRQPMWEWLLVQLERGDVAGLEWVDKDHLLFRMPWRHGLRHEWTLKRDAQLFVRWAKFTGRWFKDEKPDVGRMKANFRSAMNSLRNVEWMRHLSEAKGSNANRVYRFTTRLSESGGTDRTQTIAPLSRKGRAKPALKK